MTVTYQTARPAAWVLSLLVEATNAPFEAKDALKARGYRWQAAARIWQTELPDQQEDEERAWLRDVCACPSDRKSVV